MVMRLFVTLFVLSLLLTGCLQTNVLDKVSLPAVVGYGALEENNLQVTVCFVETLPDAEEKTRIASVHANTSKGARVKMSDLLPYNAGSGQTRVILLDRDVFKYNMMDVIEVLSRDPSYGDMIYVALVDGTAKDIITYPYKKIPHIGFYLYDLVDHNTMRNWVPIMTLHEFTRCRDRHSTVIDLAMPVIKRDEEELKIASLALFHADKIVGEATTNEGYLIKTMKGEKSQYLYEVEIDNEELEASGMKKYIKNQKHPDKMNIVFNVIRVDSDMKLRQADPPTFDVNLKMDIDIQELSERYLFQEPGAMEALRHQLNEEVSNDMQQLIHKLQKLNSDCVGFGEEYRSKVRHAPLTNDNWSKLFPTAKINTNAKMSTIRTGTME